MTKKKSKKKLRIKGLILVLLFAYIIGMLIYYFINLPIKSIDIKGNFYLKDNYIINYLDIKNKSIFKLSSGKIKKKLLELDLISDAKIKKNYLGSLTIDIVEDKILFYDWNIEKIVLSSGKKINYSNEYLGIPNLINYVPDEIYEELIKSLSIVDRQVLSVVSEIEYSPNEINNKIVDDRRFLMRMNDGNVVYVNTINMDKFNSYLELYESIVNKNGDVNGCLYLDSNTENKHFNKCKETERESKVEEGSNGEN